MSVDGAVIRALALRPDSPPSKHVIDITTTGARTGSPRRIEIWFHRIGGHFYLTGMPVRRSWYANLRKHPKFVVHLKRGVTADLPATAVAVDEETRRRVIPAVVALQNRPEYAARGVPRQDVDVWLAHSPLIEFIFDDSELQAAAARAE
jgi:deazaflavin-dependent oxidoreductase (nitroreductase family)